MSHPLVPHVSQQGALSASDATLSDAVSQATTFAMSIIPMLQHLLLLSLVPVVLGIISSYQGRFSAAASKYMAKFRREFIRTIDYTASSDYYFNLKSDNRNNILQKAILMHVSKMKGHRYPDGLMMLVEPSEEDSSKSRRYPFKSKDESSAEILRNMCISTMPSYGVWEVIDPNISLMHTERDLQGADLYERRTLFQFKLKTNHRDGGKIIDAFLDKCMKSYKEMLRRTEDKARYMFQLQLGMSKTEDNGTRPPVFKKYKLSDEKTFDSLFLPRKDETLRLVDDFLKRDGKFSIEGFPQKLGLLLHGPPGTGKTSFVKALATYTGRHIVSVPLGKITTNQELYDIMFEGEYPCIGDDGIQQRFSFNEIIFLIEEIDAASDIVRSRKTRAGQESTMQRYHSSQLFDSTRPPNEPLISTAMKKNPHLNTGGGMARAATMPEYTETAQEAGVITLRRVPHDKTVEPTVIRLATAGSAAAVAAPAVPVVVPPVVGASEGAIDALLSGLTGGDTLLATADKLDLAGLLNVLDGVVDSPGRIVIMTTNHPERLDAALIRPGRINKKLHFGFMQHPEMIAMLSHHYGELKPANIEVLNQILIDKNQDALVEGDECGFCISPAEIEQLCAEADTLEEFFSCLRKFPDLVAHAY